MTHTSTTMGSPETTAGERILTADDLAAMAAGAAVLGTGGGGDPYIGLHVAEAVLRRLGPVRLVPLETVPDDAVVVPVGMMGAPTVLVEKPPLPEQVGHAVDALTSSIGRRPTHIASIEAGGLNSLMPILAAAQLGLPLVDADCVGRALPELQMMTPGLHGLSASPACLADEHGTTVVIRAESNHEVERLARQLTVAFGATAAISLYPLTGTQARGTLIAGTLSLCGDLGRMLLDEEIPVQQRLDDVVGRLAGRRLFTGKVVDVSRNTVDGFDRGEARLEGIDGDDGRELVLHFQNEHLLALVDGELAVSVPDLICVVDAEYATAVTAETIRYGNRLTVFSSPAHPMWHTPEGLALVAPRAFGYDFDPAPCGPTVR